MIQLQGKGFSLLARERVGGRDEIRRDAFPFLSSIPERHFSSISFFLIFRMAREAFDISMCLLACLPLCKSLVRALECGRADEERRVEKGEVSIKLSDTP